MTSQRQACVYSTRTCFYRCIWNEKGCVVLQEPCKLVLIQNTAWYNIVNLSPRWKYSECSKDALFSNLNPPKS
jgi:hypothetical protein